jgi:mannose-6-phosphate isomerase-like protein (cupin superfamily)
MTAHEPGSTGIPYFPAAVGLSHLRVYDSVAPDGLVGGSPHVHLASAEAYVVVSGSGRVETLSVQRGAEDFTLAPGHVVWFEPGLIHRLVNLGGLEIMVVMQNAGLPEAGDAVLVLPPENLADPDRYASITSLPDGTEEDRLAHALRRRDLAVKGFLALRDATRAGDLAPLRAFFDAAVALKGSRVDTWRTLWRGGALAEAELTGRRLEEVAAGRTDLLQTARVRAMTPAADHPGIGMCGRLDTYLPEGVMTLDATSGLLATYGKD